MKVAFLVEREKDTRQLDYAIAEGTLHLCSSFDNLLHFVYQHDLHLAVTLNLQLLLMTDS